MISSLLNQKELAAALGRSRWFVRKLEQRGLTMPATLEQAQKFYRAIGHPFSRKPRNSTLRPLH